MPAPKSGAGHLLAIDIGNTSVAIGVFDGEDLIATFRIATDQDNFADEYAILLLGLLRSRDLAPADISAAIMSSTVPPLITTFQQVCRAHFDVEPIVVGPGVKTGVRVLYDNPREVGA
ncbi:MAG: type III pantothenate kinase, partial [Chloroflexota bacterium]